MPARVQNLALGFGSAKQVNISTISPTFWRPLKINADIPYLEPGTETDAPWIGKTDEFAHNVYKTSIQPASQRIEKYGSAEFALWAWGYALGNVGLSTSLYTIHPIDPATTTECPYFSVVAQLAEGGSTAIDEAHIGCSIESVETTFKYGPGLASVKTTAEYVGSGISAVPSAISLPATITEDYALSSSATVSINGIDYVAGSPGAKTILSGSMGWKNNYILGLRYFPGSGIDGNGFAIGGRTLIGVRVPTFSFEAFLQHDSTEFAKLVAQTTGTATINLSFDATHYMQWFYGSVSFKMVTRKAEEGFASVMVTVEPKYDSTVVGGLPNGPLVVTGKCALTDIAQSAIITEFQKGTSTNVYHAHGY